MLIGKLFFYSTILNCVLITFIEQGEKFMALSPLSNFVIIDPSAVADKIGSIYIPPNAQEKSQKGTVVAVGPGDTQYGIFVSTVLKVGDVVLFQRYSGIEVEDDGKKVVIMRENEVFSKVS